jgi:hypothetical protein
MIVKKIAFGLFVFCHILLTAQLAPKYANDFLQIGVGARSAGLGNAVVASCHDATSVYWNPAFLPEIDAERELFFMHSEYFAGIAKYDVASVAANLKNNQGLGLAYVRFGIDNIPNTVDMVDAQGNVHYDKIVSFSAIDQAFFGSYAKKLNDSLRIGGSIKIIRRRLGDFAGSWGAGIDLAISGNYSSWKWALVLRDATTSFNAWSYTLSDKMKEVFLLTGNEIPKNHLELTLPRLLVGVGKEIFFLQHFTFYPEMDMDITWDGKRNTFIRTSVFSIDPHVGMEFSYKDVVFLRMGLMNMQRYSNSDGKMSWTVQPSMGLGIKLAQKISLDYAFTDVGNMSIALYSHVISFHINFSASKSSL